MEDITRLNIVLASGSPRRRELLQMIIPVFTVAESRDIDESYPVGMPAFDVPVYLSQIKAQAYSDLITENVVLVTADTVVISDNKILGKPKNASEARLMLKLLSNREHIVVTGVTLQTTKKGCRLPKQLWFNSHHLQKNRLSSISIITSPLTRPVLMGYKNGLEPLV